MADGLTCQVWNWKWSLLMASPKTRRTSLHTPAGHVKTYQLCGQAAVSSVKILHNCDANKLCMDQLWKSIVFPDIIVIYNQCTWVISLSLSLSISLGESMPCMMPRRRRMLGFLLKPQGNLLQELLHQGKERRAHHSLHLLLTWTMKMMRTV